MKCGIIRGNRVLEERENDFKEIRIGGFLCSPRGYFTRCGSDHAYLPIELVERGQIKSAIAGEVVEGPYQSAVKNVEAHGLRRKSRFV